MKPKTLLILGTVTALLGLFVYFVERDLPSTDEQQELATKVLALETDDVVALTLHAEDRQVRLERVEPGADTEKDGEDGESETEDASEISETTEPEWRITSPIEARADAQAVRGLLGKLIGLRSERTIEDVEPSAAGLEEPRAVVVLATEDGEATLEVGVDVPLSQDTLVRVTGETGGTAATGKVVQTGFGESLRDEVGKDAGDWRDKRLFFARRSDVQRLAWTGPDGTRAVLTRSGDRDEFFLSEPVADRADRDQVRGLLTSLTTLEASSFVDDETASPSFEPLARFEVTLQNHDQPWLLELAELDTPQPLGRVSGPKGGGGTMVRLATGPVTDALGGPSDKWRSTAWTHQQVFQVDEAIFDQAGQDLLAIRRYESDWLRTVGDEARVSEDAEGETAGEEVAYTAASNVLYPLAEVKAERLVSKEEAKEMGVDLSKPHLSVTLVSDDGEETLHLYGRTNDGLFAAQTDGRNIVLLLPAENVDELLEAVHTLRDADPVSSPVSLPTPSTGDETAEDDTAEDDVAEDDG